MILLVKTLEKVILEEGNSSPNRWSQRIWILIQIERILTINNK